MVSARKVYVVAHPTSSTMILLRYQSAINQPTNTCLYQSGHQPLLSVRTKTLVSSPSPGVVVVDVVVVVDDDDDD